MYKVLQYSPNNRLSVFSVQHSSRENVNFRPSQRYKAQGPLQQSPGQHKEPPALLLSPGVAGHWSWPMWPWGTWFTQGMVLGSLAPPGMSWHILIHPGTLWDLSGPSWRS